MLGELSIRRAGPDEIAVAYAIDDDACSLYEQAGLLLDFAPALSQKGGSREGAHRS